MLLLPSQFSVKPNHFRKCLGMRFKHLRLEMEIRNILLLGVVPSGHVLHTLHTYIQVERDVRVKLLLLLCCKSYDNAFTGITAVVE